MKSKILKILGVGLTLSLLASMMVVTTPASAGTLSLSAESNVPKTDENLLAPDGANLVGLAGQDDTWYILTNSAGDNMTYKSTDSGATWTSLEQSTSYPSPGTSIPTHVAMAPDDPDVVVVAFSDGHLEYSDNGGGSWSDMGEPDGTGSLNIYDIDVSPAVSGNHYLAVGGDDGSSNAALYVLKLDIAENWHDRTSEGSGFGPDQDVIAAVKFSPNFSIDKIITSVSGNASNAYFNAYREESGARTWNGEISFFDAVDWAGGVSIESELESFGSGLVAADIALPSNYLGTDLGERIAFVAVTGGTGGGAVRVVDSYAKKFETWSSGDEKKVSSIAYHEDGKILVGDYDDPYVLADYDPMASTPRFERVDTLKMPGGTGKVIVAWSGDTAVAATSGDESAFAVSTDDGNSFNDISMIDTRLDTITEVGVAADGSMVSVTTNDASGDASVWLKSSSWKRIKSNPGLTDGTTASFMVRLAPEDPNVVYVASKTTTDIWVSKDAGMESWKHVPCYKVDAVQDLAVASEDLVYAIDTAGSSKTTNSGASWGTKKTLDGVVGFMVTVASNGDILVGGSDGYVAFSKDSGSTFTRITDKSDTADVYVVPDADYASNNIIYIGAGNEVERGAAEKTKTWSSREPASDEPAAFPSNTVIKGIAEYEGIIYVLTDNGTDSRLYRALNLKTADTSAKSLWSYLEASGESYSFTPRAMTISSGPKIWTVDQNSPALESATDPIAATAPTLNSPVNNFTVPVNPGSGQAYNVSFSWERHSYRITAMDLQISTDSGFDGVIYTGNFDLTDVTSDTIAKSIGPTGQSGQVVDFNPGQTYYWRVRVGQNGPLYSPWSSSRSITVAPSESFAVQSPEIGATDVPIQPTLTWVPFEGADSYEVAVAEDSTFAILDYSHTTSDTFFKGEETLKYSTTYYWRVRGVEGSTPGPWVEGVFTTEAAPVEPTPPVVIEPTPPSEVKIVEVPVIQPSPIPDYLLWTIIAIGAVLIIALIILIVRTRRVA
jgi:hypothetical protein